MSGEPDKRIDAWLDGEIDEVGRDALNAWLLESPENAARFAERSHMHSRLFDWARARGAACEAESGKVVRPRFRWRPLAAAAAIVVGAGLAFALVNRPPMGEPVARLVENIGAELVYRGRGSATEEGVLLTGEYHLSQGLVEIALESGVKLLIEAPARYRIDSGERLFLHKGRVAAVVPPEGVGFTIDSPGAEVVDLGTEFAMEVSEDRASEVHVFKGEVEVLPKSDSVDRVDPVFLLTNAATRVEFNSGVPVGIPIDGNRFLRSLDEPTSGYAGVMKESSPSLYFRMKVSSDGETVRDAWKGVNDTRYARHDGIVIKRGSARPPWASGKVGSAGRFEGPADGAFVYLPEAPKAGSSDFSVSCWVMAESRPRLATIAADGTVDEPSQFRWGLDRDSGQMLVRIHQRDGEDAVVREDLALPVGEWHHVAFVADGSMLRLYRNGIEVGATPCGRIAEATSPALAIGAQLKGDGLKPKAANFWHGRIDEFALFDHALTSEEVMRQFRGAD